MSLAGCDDLVLEAGTADMVAKLYEGSWIDSAPSFAFRPGTFRDCGAGWPGISQMPGQCVGCVQYKMGVVDPGRS